MCEIVNLGPYVADQCPRSEFKFQVVARKPDEAVTELALFDPALPTITVLPWNVIKTPAHIHYLASEYDPLGLGMYGIEWFLSDTVLAPEVNVLRIDGELIDMERVIPDHLLNAYADPKGERDTHWYLKFLVYAAGPPGQSAGLPFKARYSMLSLGMQMFKASTASLSW